MNCGWIQRGPAESWVSKDNDAGAWYLLCIRFYRVFHHCGETWARQLTSGQQTKAQSFGWRTCSAQRRHQGKTQEEARKARRLHRPRNWLHVWSMRRGSPRSANIRERCALTSKATPQRKPSQLPDSLALYPAPVFSVYSLTNKPFKQTILCRNHCFYGPALHSRGEEPRTPCRSLDSDVSQTEGWIFPEVTEKLHHVAEGKAVSDKTWAKSFDSSLPLRCPRIHWQVGAPNHSAKLALGSLSSKPRGCFYFALHGKEYTESKGENLFQMKWEKGFLLRQGLV